MRSTSLLGKSIQYPCASSQRLAHQSIKRYALSVATSIMLYMVIKRPSSEVARRVRRSKGL